MRISKLYLAVFFLLGLGGGRVKAQTNGLYVGLERSPQWSWLHTGSPALHSGIRFGDQYGLLIHYEFYKRLGIAVNAIVSTQHAGFNAQGTAYQLKNRYVKVPLQLNYIHLPMGLFTLIGRIGPEVNFLSQATLSQQDLAENNNVKTAFRSVGIGATAYAGFRLSIVDFVSLNLGIRLDQDFSNGIKAPILADIPLNSGRYTTLALVFGVNILHFR